VLVTLDKNKTGTTPTTFADVPAWEHVIDVAMAGYQAWVKKVNVKGGKVLYIDATLIKSPPETGILSISSNPAGADVYIDAVYRGFTPKSIGNIVPGPHRVNLVLAGEQEWVSDVMVFPGDATVLSPVLTPNANPLTGAVHVDSRPIGAAIYLDGNFIGITCGGDGFDITNVIPGTHQITLRMKGFSDYTTSVNVPADRIAKIIPTIILSQIHHPSGQVQSDSVPEGAGVYLDGKFTGYTPLTVHDIAVGQHDVRMKMEGREEFHDIIRVTAYETAQVRGVIAPHKPAPTRAGVSPAAAMAALGLTGCGTLFLFSKKRVPCSYSLFSWSVTLAVLNSLRSLSTIYLNSTRYKVNTVFRR
jgi:hypothetical protein